jgi:chemotaxis protein methyltransferase CheR
MANGKQALVSGRLAKRLAHYQLNSYGDYLKLLESRAIPAELQMAVDLLTTNETYFFREPKHFALLRELARKRATEPRAACGAPPVPAARNRTASPWCWPMCWRGRRHGKCWAPTSAPACCSARARPLSDGARQRRCRRLPEALLPQGQGSEAGTMLIEKACASACSSST